MSVIRVEKTKDYTVMSNYHLKEPSMSLKSKGLLSLILSLPDDWNYSIAGLVSICKENETSIKNTLDELKQFGYLEITKVYPNESKSGRIEYVYTIYERPKQEGKKQGLENLPLENLGLENQDLENQGQLNTNNQVLNNQLLNDKEFNISIDVEKIILYLNEKAKTNYRSNSKNTIKHIKARFNEKYTVEDFIKVIDIKCKEWLNTDMEKYLRPETLFGTKFESYLNQKEKKEDIPEWFDKEYKRKELLNDEERRILEEIENSTNKS